MARLADDLGKLLRTERESGRLTQAELAREAGVTRQQVSRLEAGGANVTTALIEAVFSALGLQLCLSVEPIGAELDRVVADPGKFLLLLNWAQDWGRNFAAPAPTMVLDGAIAACMLGVPVQPTGVHALVAAADLDDLARWLLCQPSLSRRGAYYVDPREPGPLHYDIADFEMRLTLVECLPAATVVRADNRDWQVRPLHEIMADHPDVARVVERAKRR